MEQIHINFSQFNSLIALVDYFNTEDKCKAAIAQQRWGDGEAVCPYCGCTHTYSCSDGRYSCPNCHKKFSVLVGTIFENTKLSLRKWFMAMYMVSSTKKGVSSHQLARDLGVTQKTMWFMLHKIRGLYGLTDEIELDGEVEMDEMYLGGRETNKHESKKVEGTQGRSTKTKTPIFGMLERDGKVVAMKVEDTKGATLMPIVGQFVKEGTVTYTDEVSIYNNLTKNGYEHLFVNHGKREYVRSSDIHTNGIEGFWAHFKRVIFSTYHCVSKDYVQRYIDEQVYRWNTREEKSSYRFHDMFSKACKHFDYNDVLALSSVVDTEYRTFHNKVYYAWYTHGKREYVRANDIHTNGIEGFWAHFKRVVFGTYHCVSKDYLPRYIDEQVYRWNTRDEKASVRFHDMFSKACKQFDYNDVLELSSVVCTEYRTFAHNVYYHWYMHRKSA